MYTVAITYHRALSCDSQNPSRRFSSVLYLKIIKCYITLQPLPRKMESCKSLKEPDLYNSCLGGPFASPFCSVLPFWGQRSVESLIVISAPQKPSLWSGSYQQIFFHFSATQFHSNVHLYFNDLRGAFLLYFFFYQKITRLLSSSPGARLWESSVIRRKSPSFIVFFSFLLLLFLLCGRHATSGVNIIDATATRRYCEHVNECSQQVL